MKASSKVGMSRVHIVDRSDKELLKNATDAWKYDQDYDEASKANKQKNIQRIERAKPETRESRSSQGILE